MLYMFVIDNLTTRKKKSKHMFTIPNNKMKYSRIFGYLKHFFFVELQMKKKKSQKIKHTKIAW